MKSAEAAKEASRLLGSQVEMARLLKVTAPTVNQWCSGERKSRRSLPIFSMGADHFCGRRCCAADRRLRSLRSTPLTK